MSVNNVLTPYDTVIYCLDIYLIMYMSFPVALSFVLLAAFHHKALQHVQTHFRPASAQKNPSAHHVSCGFHSSDSWSECRIYVDRFF